MFRTAQFSFLTLALIFLASLAAPVQAQHRLGSRTFVAAPQALGMGSAAAAFPSPQTALFYNPAHLTRLRVTKSPITMLGLGVALTNNVRDQYAFYNDHLLPALDAGIDNLDDATERSLYDDMFRLGSTPTVLTGDILLPSFAMNRGNLGFGGGLFIHTETAYRVEDAGAGVPGLDFTSLADFMAVASVASDFSSIGARNLSAGVTAKYAQRYLMLKDKPLDAFEEDESLYVLGDAVLGFDLGMLYELKLPSVPGQLYLGATWYDLTLGEQDYKFAAYYVRNEEVQKDDVIAEEVALARERFQVHSSFRGGAAYVLPALGGPLKETAIAVDYVTGSMDTDALLGHLSLGVQTTLGSRLALRTGLNQGYTSLGFGINLTLVQIDYAYYGSEQGRLPGQSPSWHHRVQISLGSF